MGNWRADFYAVDGGLTLAALPAPNGILWNCPHVLTQKIAAPAFTAEVTLDARALQIGEQAGFGLIGGQYAYIALRRTAAGMRLVFVQSDGEAHQERVCEEIDAPAEQLALRWCFSRRGTTRRARRLRISIRGIGGASASRSALRGTHGSARGWRCLRCRWTARTTAARENSGRSG